MNAGVLHIIVLYGANAHHEIGHFKSVAHALKSQSKMPTAPFFHKGVL
ncbi:MAG: hypothetical protein ACLR6O_04790 [Eubacterium sp.]